MTLPAEHKLGICRYSGTKLSPLNVLDDECCCFDYEQTVTAMKIKAEVYDEARRELHRRVREALRAKTKPAADRRAMSGLMRQIYVALINQGFNERQALTLIGEVFVANAPNQGDPPGAEKWRFNRGWQRRDIISPMSWNLSVSGHVGADDEAGVRETEERIVDALRQALVSIGAESARFSGSQVTVDFVGERNIGQEGRPDAPDSQRSPTSQPGVSVDPDGTVHDTRPGAEAAEEADEEAREDPETSSETF